MSSIIMSIILVMGILAGAAATQSGYSNFSTVKADGATPSKPGLKSTTTQETKSNHKEFTLIAEDATIEMSPGERVNVWTYNGTVPGPTLRFTEGDNVTIHFINKTPMAHTVHLHGNHDDQSDGAYPLILPNQTYNYNFIADPSGAFLYHCHAPPASLHIRMGMYGLLIVDPKKPLGLKPAKEFSLVLSEFDPKNPEAFITKYYPINGYVDQYTGQNALQVRQNELVRFYIVNIGTTITYSFHLHSTIFKVYQSGLITNSPIDVQTISIPPGDAVIAEVKWKSPGTYLFHSHGLQEERGNMGEIHVIADTIHNNMNINSTGGSKMSSGPVPTQTMSMIGWQYNLQKKLQKPMAANAIKQDAEAKEKHDNVLASNATTITKSPTDSPPKNSATIIRILKGSSDNKQEENFRPEEFTAKIKSQITWINEDNIPHTVTSEKAGEFDSSIIATNQRWKHTFDLNGIYEYYCTLHPWMKGKIIVTI